MQRYKVTMPAMAPGRPKGQPNRPALKAVLNFEGIGPCFWRGLVWKLPERGDWFVSGAIPEAYRARQHLTTHYWCVEPTEYAKPAMTYVRAEAVQVTAGGTPLPRNGGYTE